MNSSNISASGRFDVTRHTHKPRRYTTRSKNTVVEFKDREAITDALTEMLKNGEKQSIPQVAESSLEEFLSQHSDRSTGQWVVTRKKR